MNTGQWTYAGLNFNGLSLAGVRTSIAIPELSLAFDLAQGLPHAIGMNHFLITHGHMDHSAGIPYVISQKAMHSHKTPHFYMPESMVEPMKEIMNQWSLIEGHQYDFQFTGLKTNEAFTLSSRYLVKTFETVHRIPSLGYSIYRRFRKLRKDLEGKASEEIAAFRQRGEDPTEERTELVVSFTGDTQIEFLDKAPEVANSKILLMEATYLNEKKTVASAKEWGHTHLDELIPRLPSIKSEKIVLIHSSARYSFEEAQSILMKRLPKTDIDRVVLFPGR
ncbi:MBL fold metallo-hydrolase [Peredibacter starrii]|uniref:MBL fold metallo-hydrolase n=1 Tax=Peredibacter starrii TaxID=28202 RepID=A0AAX4HTL6_9BACT|nr:MBL fold metallo-hydrolase [Peredibacter starrii]WPU66617.1 MBL fold metallo-hydrolase [Peredibacter starrii]